MHRRTYFVHIGTVPMLIQIHLHIPMHSTGRLYVLLIRSAYSRIACMMGFLLTVHYAYFILAIAKNLYFLSLFPIRVFPTDPEQ